MKHKHVWGVAGAYGVYCDTCGMSYSDLHEQQAREAKQFKGILGANPGMVGCTFCGNVVFDKDTHRKKCK